MIRNPDEIAAYFVAFAQAYNAELAAPLAREQREADRLADLLRVRYSGPGAWRYIGQDNHSQTWLYGLGYFERQGDGWPCDLKAVNALAACLRVCHQAQKVNVALLAAKRLVALLREAQKQCDEEPEPLALSRLNRPAEFAVLQALAVLCQHPEDRAALKDIEGLTELSAKSIRLALKSLASAGLSERAGTDGGTTHRPTAEGHRCAAWFMLH